MNVHTTTFRWSGLCTLILFVFFASVSQAQETLVKWDFEGKGGQTSVASYFTASGISTVVPSVVASLGTGLLPRNYLSNGLTASRQNYKTLSGAIAGGDYISFTVSPAEGKKISISKVRIRPVAESKARYFCLFSSVGGFDSAAMIGSIYDQHNFNAPLFDIPVPGLNDLTTPVEFRVYIYGDYGNIYQGVGFGNATGDDLVIEGLVEDAYIDVPFDVTSLPELQLGLSGISYYGAPVFANALYLENRNWRDKTTGATISHFSGQLDENGYPLFLESGQILYAQPGQNNSFHKRLYKGRVALVWEGEADIRITNASSLVSGTSSGMVTDGKREYQFNSEPNGYVLEIREINQNNPPRKIRVWMPDPADPMNKSLEPAAGNGEPMFHPSYLALLNKQQFSILRFMDWGHTNANPLVDWADRRPMNHCFQSGYINERNSPGWNATYGDKKQSAGVSYETMIKLCNTLNKDMWVCVPHGATDDFITKMARLIKGEDPDGTGSPGLNPGLKVYLEYSNEIWAPNSNTFCQGQYAAQMCALDGISREKWIARRFNQVWSIFQSVFGGNQRIVRVAATWTSSTDYTSKYLAEATIYGLQLSPPAKPDVMAVTTYFGNGIQQYVYTDVDFQNPTPATYDQVFREWENRLMSSEATTTGQDFTGGGGGVPGALVDLADQYNIPIVAYEGGTGLQFADFVSAVGCDIVPKGTAGSVQKELACLAGGCSGGDCNNSPYHQFMYALSRDPRIKDMFYIHNTLAKAKGVYTVTQFGDITSMGKYGFWGFAEYIDQPADQIHKYNFWMNWEPEQRGIREIQHPKNAVPQITTQGELYPAKVGQACSYEINYSGGDGALTIDTVGSGFLPPGLNFSYATNKVNIVGTPSQSGTYRFCFRVLDSDNDPAYSVFTLRVLPAPMDSVFAIETFGDVSRKLDDSQNGYGFSSWDVQANDTIFAIKTASPLAYPGLQSSGSGYAVAGSAYRSADISMKISQFDYLVPANNTSVVGQTNTELWMSALVKRVPGCAKSDVLFLMDGDCGYCDDNRLVKITVLANGNWGLKVRKADKTFAEFDSQVSATAHEGQTVLLVLGVKFDQTTDSILLYINPSSLGGAQPANPAIACKTTGDMDMLFKNLGIYGSKDANKVSYDDIRLGDTYKAVTPVAQAGMKSAALANSMKRQEASTALVIYPNPAVEKLFVANVAECADIQIINTFGQVMLSSRATSSNVELSLESLQSGIYFVRIVNQGQQPVVERFVKQ